MRGYLVLALRPPFATRCHWKVFLASWFPHKEVSRLVHVTLCGCKTESRGDRILCVFAALRQTPMPWGQNTSSNL